jgi:hypothetical protein
MTKSNIGVDIDSQPPTAEISVARREVVIAPVFEHGQSPPVAASFQFNWKGLIGLFANISSTFLGGDAAATTTKLYGEPDSTTPESSALCLNALPTESASSFTDTSLGTVGGARPFLFGTDTSLGLKVAWSGMTAQYPDTVKLGYNRKEFAWAPVFGSAQSCPLPGGGTGTHSVRAPSFLATVDTTTDVNRPQDSRGDYVQYFATGVAATNLSLRQEVRVPMLRRLDPNTAPARDAAQDKIDALRARGLRARAKALAAIDRLSAAQLPAAWDIALFSRVVDAGETFPNQESARRQRLKDVAAAGSQEEPVSNLEMYAAKLEELAKRGGS